MQNIQLGALWTNSEDAIWIYTTKTDKGGQEKTQLPFYPHEIIQNATYQ